MKLLVCGDRHWGVIPKNLHEYTPVFQARLVRKAEGERVRLRDWLDALNGDGWITQVIEGEAPGADTFGRVWGESRGIEVRRFPAEWKLYGRAAGPLRNTQMLVEGQPARGVAFHNNLSESRGTANMVRQLTKAGLPVWVVGVDYEELR